jgi:acetyl-CoA acyltransferase
MDAFILDYTRSPFHFAKKGALAGVRPDDLAAQVVRALISRQKFAADELEDVIMGCAYPESEQGDNVARIVSFLAGLPERVGGITVNRFCGSSMSAVHIAAGSIATGGGDAFLCAGLESMTRVPQGGLSPSHNPRLESEFPQAYTPMGITAENVAERYHVSRAEQEQFATRSQRKAAAAVEARTFERELIPIQLADGSVVAADGCLRPATTPEALAKLKPAFLEHGTVTAGTASPLTDGAAAVLVVSEAFLRKHDLKPLAQIKAIAVAGVAPEIMGMGPVSASQKALVRAGLSASDLDVIEINEAFASQALASLRELGIDEARVNLDGGAIALGHPLGATGARITGKAASLLQRTQGRYALATQCIGGGQGVATILERC